MTQANEATIYVLVRAGTWQEEADAPFHRGTEADRRDGYLHLSTASQIRESAAKHYAGVADLLLVAVDPSALGPTLRWEAAAGGKRPGLFPHLHGALPRTAVRAVVALPLGPDGRHCFP